MIFCFLVSMLLQITSKKLESHLRHANAIRRLSMKKKYLSEQKPTFSVITGFRTATAGVSRDARDAR